MLQSVASVVNLIREGRRLLLAGSAAALAELPPGDWIGGSICYFMDRTGGLRSDDLIFVTEVPTQATRIDIRQYQPDDFFDMYRDAPDNGFTFLLIPYRSRFLEIFARDACRSEGFLVKPMVGWVTGVPLEKLGVESACVVNGQTLESFSEGALAMHIALPYEQFADLTVVNIFKPGDGDAIAFSRSSLCAGDCFINGKAENFADYIAAHQIDAHLPLTADYCGTIINIALKPIESSERVVHFHNPVRAGIVYRFAAPVSDYAAAFREALQQPDEPLFSCNSLLNFLHGKQEGKEIEGVAGPVTYGEIAHMLLNQTLVQLRIRTLA